MLELHQYPMGFRGTYAQQSAKSQIGFPGPMLHEECPRSPKLPKVPGEKRTKRQGKKHGGLPALVIEPYAGIRELQLSRWDSSAGTVIKGEGYMDFINNCGFKVDDVVEIWAFKESYFRLFGVDMCHESSLFLLLTKKE